MWFVIGNKTAAGEGKVNTSEQESREHSLSRVIYSDEKGNTVTTTGQKPLWTLTAAAVTVLTIKIRSIFS